MARYFDPDCTVDILKEKIQEAIKIYCDEEAEYFWVFFKTYTYIYIVKNTIGGMLCNLLILQGKSLGNY